MKAVRYDAFGGPEVLRWADVPEPVVGASEVLIRVEAAGVNFSDLMRRQGLYSKRDPLPAMLGVEGAGTIVRVGQDVHEFHAGERVICWARGAQAELMTARAASVIRMPPSCTPEQGAAIPVAFVTAYHMLKTLAPLQPGESVLIQAAASGVGTAAVQLAVLWGARVFATASSDDKLKLAGELGARELINYARQDFVAEVLARTGNRGVDRVLECVGGEVLTKSLKALTAGGILMVYGRASGSLPLLSPEDFFPRNLRIFGVHIGMPPWGPGTHRAALSDILALVATGRVRPIIDRTFKMADVAEAHKYLAERRTRGKVLLVP